MWTGPQVLDLPCLGLQLCLGGVALVPAPNPQLRLELDLQEWFCRVVHVNTHNLDIV